MGETTELIQSRWWDATSAHARDYKTVYGTVRPFAYYLEECSIIANTKSEDGN